MLRMQLVPCLSLMLACTNLDLSVQGNDVEFSLADLWIHSHPTPTSPPAALELRRIGTLHVVRDDDHARVWTRYDGDSEWVETTLYGLNVDPAAVKLLVAYGEDGMGIDTVGFLVAQGPWAYRVDEAYDAGPTQRFLALSERRPPEEVLIERAPEISAPLSDEEAWDNTVALRWMKTCPRSFAECFLWGSASDVEGAVDPALPPGGWSLFPVDRSGPEPAQFVPERSQDDSLLVECAFFDSDAGRGRSLDDDGFSVRDRLRVSYRGPQGQETSFVAPVYECDPHRVQKLGARAVGQRVVVWAWDPEQTLLAVALHDKATGQRLGGPWVVHGEPYYEPQCGNVYGSTRPVPVLYGDSLAVALVWGDDQGGLLFRSPGAFGEETLPLELGIWNVHDDAMPAVLRWVGDELHPARFQVEAPR